jgi:hypothetical protein
MCIWQVFGVLLAASLGLFFCTVGTTMLLWL